MTQLKWASSERKKLKTNAPYPKSIDIIEPINANINVCENERLVSSQSISLQKRNINKKLYNHYLIKSSYMIAPKNVHQPAMGLYDVMDFKIQRVNKKIRKYVRISVKTDLNIAEQSKIPNIENALGCKLKEQSLKRNINLEQQIALNKTKMTIMSLNINGLESKISELILLIEEKRPDIILLQETRRKSTEKKINLPNYSVFEVAENQAGRGLLIGVRNNL